VTENREPSFEQYREELQAELKLAEVALYEELAVAAETEPLPELRTRYVAEYRRLLGIVPDDREEFQAALKRIRAGNGGSVETAITKLNFRRQENGLSVVEEDGTVIAP
jgi:hypothetical protein